MAKPRLISGMQPTGKPHLGNYLGMLQVFIDAQDIGDYDCYFFIADLHSLTNQIKTKDRRKAILETTSLARSFGVHEGKCTVFLQSAVSAHSELAIILNNVASFGDLRRMTQFKDRAGIQSQDKFNDFIDKVVSPLGFQRKEDYQNINAGLFDYPVLMAADILLYDAKFVPVGEDQLQHLELARRIARSFNKFFPKTFVEPKPLLNKEISRVMSLDEPRNKMSKSHPKGCLFLDDSPKDIKKKIMGAVTDSDNKIKYNPERKPGISNLILLNAVMSELSIEDVEKKYADKNYSDLKQDLSERIIDLFTRIQEEKRNVSKGGNKKSSETVLEEGNEKADKIASKKLEEVKKKLGLYI